MSEALNPSAKPLDANGLPQFNVRDYTAFNGAWTSLLEANILLSPLAYAKKLGIRPVDVLESMYQDRRINNVEFFPDKVLRNAGVQYGSFREAYVELLSEGISPPYTLLQLVRKTPVEINALRGLISVYKLRDIFRIMPAKKRPYAEIPPHLIKNPM